MVAIVDDDDLMRSALQGLLKSVGLPAQAFASAEEFLQSGQQDQVGCLVADIRMPGMSGLELQAKLNSLAEGEATIRVRRSDERGHTNHGWIDLRNAFSFANLDFVLHSESGWWILVTGAMRAHDPL